MTRDEVIDRLAEVHTPVDVAKAICHDAFDIFVNEYADHPLEDPATVATRWRGFREGWDKGQELGGDDDAMVRTVGFSDSKRSKR